VSSRTGPTEGPCTMTSTLTVNDANQLRDAQREWRLTLEACRA
jgi:hypothetical protein